jgi:tRNA A-37 threonylcarbamoyl transferase component Bud32
VNFLDDFLVQAGLAAAGDRCIWTPLSGGVSSDIWRVDIEKRPSLCVKRALPKLKVAAHWEAPVSRNAYEWAYMQFVSNVIPHGVPGLLAHDPIAGLFAMEYLPPEHFPSWKQQLMDGKIQARTAQAVGRGLGAIHSASANRDDLRARFDTSDSFHAIRLEPYLLATARRHPRLQRTLEQLVERTATHRSVLVHGDVSPKNILVGANGPVFLDAECAWYGDPAFDLAFCLNHLLLKCIVQPRQTTALRESFDGLVSAYFMMAAFESRQELEFRVASLLPALLLARIDGKSPVEYVTTESDRSSARDVAIPMIERPPASVRQVADRWFESATTSGRRGADPQNRPLS